MKTLFLIFLGILTQVFAQPTGKYGGGNAAGYASAQFNNGLALVVELSTFSAVAEDDGVHLQWLTEREWNNSHFEVEHSADGHSFAAIGWIAGAGNRQQESTYAFVDYAPKAGRNYYRIKDVDWNGQSHFSEVKEVLFVAENDFRVFPNPTVGSFSIHIPQNIQHTAFILRILSITGQEIWRKSYSSISAQEIGPFKLPNSSSGLYTIQLSSSNQRWSRLLRVY